MPSKKILEGKQAAVAELAEKMKKAAVGIVVQYQGITAEDDTKLRAALRAAGVEYKVVKNTITSRACDEVGYGAMKEHLEGMTALAICENDPVAPAKILKEYVEKIEPFQFKIGFIDGEVIDVPMIEELAETPSKEIMIGKIMGSLQSPLYGLCYALQAIIDKSGEAAHESAEAAEASAEA